MLSTQHLIRKTNDDSFQRRRGSPGRSIYRNRRPPSLSRPGIPGDGARDIAQTISLYSGASHLPDAILQVKKCSTWCEVRESVTSTAIVIDSSPASASIFHLRAPIRSVTLRRPVTGDKPLCIVSVCCPEDDAAETGLSPVVADPHGTTPFRTVREELQESIPAGNRTFKLLVNREFGCRRVTQFTGEIPPGRAAMHHHAYEEAIYILEGRGSSLD